jgi:hypothetical protein
MSTGRTAFRFSVAQVPTWALAPTAQQRDAEAQAVQQRFATVWKDADITLTASAF